MALNSTSKAILALLVTGFFIAAGSSDASAFFKAENTCLKKVGKGASKAAKTYAKTIAKCTDKVLAGKGGSLPCIADLDGAGLNALCTAPATKEDEKVCKSLDKARKSSVKKCASECSLTPISCIGNASCPPKLNFPELCNAKGDFDIINIGYPGALCETSLALDATLDDSGDIGQCAGALAMTVTGEGLIDGIYGSLKTTEPGIPLTSAEAACLAAASKATVKLTDKVAKAIFKCRDDINSTKLQNFDPGNCGKDLGPGAGNEKTTDKINKAEGKHADAINAKCTDGDFAALDVCGGAATDRATAIACLNALAFEASDSQEDPGDRDFSATSLVETAYPPGGECGDNAVNQTPHPFLLLGEECDGTDDSACPGECIGPGDVYECSCGNQARSRFFANGFTADLDNGWTGSSHEGGLADGAGYFTSRINCDCDAKATVGVCDRLVIDGGTGPARQISCNTDADCEAAGAGNCARTNTCIGTSNDPLCDLGGFQLPVCDWDAFGDTRCDQHGNTNFTDEDADCSICDANTLNAGAFCSSESDCQAQCFDANGVATGNFCDLQSKVCSGGSQTFFCEMDADCTAPGAPGGTCLGTPCPAGQVCKGQCDTSRDCIEFPNGGPLPIVAGATAVCVQTKHVQDVTGTFNVLDGTHENFVRQLSVVHLGNTNSVPCPTCGGFCDDPEGFLSGEVCQGTCSITTATPCRFDVDCPTGETCTSTTDQCGPNGSCNLALVCNGGANNGKSCRVEAGTKFFGTTSNDCPASTSLNISGTGLSINFLPQTDGTVSLDNDLSCTAPGFENFDCPCPQDGGATTKPNNCGFVCTAGAEFTQVCAAGSSGFGFSTRCNGGTNDLEPCDEDADCGGGTCDFNPKHCAGGDGSLLDCTDKCVGGTNNNGACIDAADCPGGGVCTDQSSNCAAPLDCVDACPSGSCQQVCLDTATFNALPKPDAAADPLGRPEDEGWCAGGLPFYKCSGDKFTFKNCPESSANGTCNATCETTLGPCETDDDCPMMGERCTGNCEKANGCAAGIDDDVLGDANDFIGAGICQEQPKGCFLQQKECVTSGASCNEDSDCVPPDPGECKKIVAQATGGGDATNVFSVSTFCIPRTINSTINNTAGLGGPGRLRQQGVNVPNFDELDTCSSGVCGDSSSCSINCPGAPAPVCDCLGGGPQAQCSCQ